MIACAPIARLTDWLTTDPDWREIRRKIPSPLGLEALRVLEEEDGNGEEGGNNRGPHIRRYGGKQGRSWCGWLQSFAIRVASERRGHSIPFSPTGGARKLFRRAVKSGMLVDLIDIQRGDLVLFDRGDPDRKSERWKAHVGMVSRVVRDTNGIVIRWFYRAGNEGRNAVVEEHEGTRSGRLIGFARLP